ncbi:MAG: MFS transporter [Streptosporangiales bacterium]|nr:MFS transporter [Streptosporangiales bacterium]MBO0891670.1 MFS transporter [Acidothermales bacterium]
MTGRTEVAAAPTPRELRRVLVGLCVTEITSWGVLYYALPVLAPAISHDMSWSTGTVMVAFSCGLVVSALAGVVVGRLLDRYGPRRVMTTGSVLGVVAVVAIALAPDLPSFIAAWAFSGVAQACLLYPPAFAALTRWYGPRRVRALTVLSLVAGLASTVFAPVTALLGDRLGWREAYLVLAVLLAAVTIPVHVACLTPTWPAEHATRHGPGAGAAAHVRRVLRTRAFWCLVVAMTVAAFGMYGSTVDLVPLSVDRGASTGLAAVTLGLVGAGQLLGRLGYGMLHRVLAPRWRTALVLFVGAVTIGLLAVVPLPALVVTAVCAGAARGTFTLLQATAVSDRWGTAHFGTLNGAFIAPVTAAIAVAPAGCALLAERLGGYPYALTLLALLVLGGAAAATGSGVSASRPDP